MPFVLEFTVYNVKMCYFQGGVNWILNYNICVCIIQMTLILLQRREDRSCSSSACCTLMAHLLVFPWEQGSIFILCQLILLLQFCNFFFNFLNLGLINISWKSHKRRLESLGLSYCWNELITLSTKYRDLTANSQLAVTVSHPSYFWNLLIIFVNNLLVYSVLKLWELGFYLLYKIM